VLDFSVAADTIVLDRSIFTRTSANGTVLSNACVTGTAAANAADPIIYDRAIGNIFDDADRTGAAAKVLFAQLNAGWC
jgi:Ca2+-binding RTX toxin-like protein